MALDANTRSQWEGEKNCRKIFIPLNWKKSGLMQYRKKNTMIPIASTDIGQMQCSKYDNNVWTVNVIYQIFGVK